MQVAPGVTREPLTLGRPSNPSKNSRLIHQVLTKHLGDRGKAAIELGLEYGELSRRILNSEWLSRHWGEEGSIEALQATQNVLKELSNGKPMTEEQVTIANQKAYDIYLQCSERLDEELKSATSAQLTEHGEPRKLEVLGEMFIKMHERIFHRHDVAKTLEVRMAMDQAKIEVYKAKVQAMQNGNQKAFGRATQRRLALPPKTVNNTQVIINTTANDPAMKQLAAVIEANDNGAPNSGPTS